MLKNLKKRIKQVFHNKGDRKMKLIFNSDAIILSEEVAVIEAETEKGVYVQIHIDTKESDIYWFEVVTKTELVYDSRAEKKIYTNQTDAENAANEWFNKF